MHAEEICAGDTLGDYELLVPIAKGGTAEVWAARRKGARGKEINGLEDIVAIKLMLSEFSDDVDAESMFFDEARLVSQIKNPNVAHVTDLGETDTALFLVMEWVDGEPINVVAREARSKGGVPISVAVQIIRQACSGLHAAHEARDKDGKLAGIVHRDVSPQNILVGYDGWVKVIDFGVAKAASNQQRTNVGQLKGKVAYMAPEQAFGEPVDRRTDVFALGIVFYQLVTGKHPFRGDNEFATLGRIRDKRPVDPPSMYAKSIPPAVEQVLLKALAKSPAERFPSMVEFSRALAEAYPSPDAGVAEIAAYMSAMLKARGERKRLAIHDAIKAVEENRAESSVPEAFAVAQADAQWATGPLDRSLIAGYGAPTPGATTTGRLDRSAVPAAALQTPPPPPITLPPAGERVTSESLLPGRLVASDPGSAPPPPSVPNFRRRRVTGKMIAAAMALLVVIALVIWGTSGDSNDPGTTSGEHPTKKPW